MIGTTAAPATEVDSDPMWKIKAGVGAGFALLGGQLLHLHDDTYAVAVGGTVRFVPDLYAARALLQQLQGGR